MIDATITAAPVKEYSSIKLQICKLQIETTMHSTMSSMQNFNNCANASILTPLSEVFKTSYIGSYLASTSNWPTLTTKNKLIF